MKPSKAAPTPKKKKVRENSSEPLPERDARDTAARREFLVARYAVRECAFEDALKRDHVDRVNAGQFIFSEGESIRGTDNPPVSDEVLFANAGMLDAARDFRDFDKAQTWKSSIPDGAKFTDLQIAICEELSRIHMKTPELTDRLNRIGQGKSLRQVKRVLAQLVKMKIVSHKRGLGYYLRKKPPIPIGG